MTTANKKNEREITMLAAVSLLAIQLVAFAIVSPQLGYSIDKWNYLTRIRRVSEINPFYVETNRQFQVWGITLADQFFPDRFQGHYYVHLLTLFGISFAYFCLLQRLFPKYVWFNYLCAALTIIYLPSNATAIMSWVALYSLPIFFSLVAANFFLAFTTGERRIWALGLACVCAYLAARMHEGGLPLIALMPFTAIYIKRQLNRRIVIGSILWWAVVAICGMMVVLPYLRQDAVSEYQRRIMSPATFSKDDLPRNLQLYEEAAFPLSKSETTYLSYKMPAFFLACIFLFTCWLMYRRFPEHFVLPSISFLVGLLITAVILTTIGGLLFYITGTYALERGLMFTQYLQATVLASTVVLLARGIHYIMQVRLRWSLAGVLLIVFVVGSQWVYDAQQNVIARGWGPFNNNEMIFWKTMLAIFPDVKDDTLFIAKDCYSYPGFSSFYHMDAAHIYEYLRGSGVQMRDNEAGWNPDINSTPEGIQTHGSYYGHVISPEQLFFDQMYPYENMIVFECQGTMINILTTFALGDGYNIDNEVVSTYNPYARVEQGFIPEERETLVYR